MLFGAKAGGHQGAPGGRWAQTMVIGGGTEKSQNVRHVDIQIRCPFLELETVILYISNLFRGLFLPKSSAGKKARRRGFEGST